jgi:hypothetical protein
LLLGDASAILESAGSFAELAKSVWVEKNVKLEASFV